MNQQPDFYNTLKNILEQEENTLKMFFIFRDKTIKQAKLSNDTSKMLLEMFLGILQNTINEDTEYKSINEFDENSRENEYLYFKNDNIYEGISFLVEYWEQLDDIDPANALEDNIFGLLFKIGVSDNYILLYQQCYAMSFLGKGKIKSLFVEGGVFEQVNKDILNISPRIDFVIDKDFFLILNQSPLEIQYGYKEVILKEAQNIIDTISAINFVKNLNILQENLNPTNAKKLRKTDEKVLKMFEDKFEEVKSFVENHTKLKGSLKFNENNKIEITSKKEMNFFIKLLTNDYLRSLLTNEDFDSSSKRKL